jgi:hypothetical protein
MQNPGASFLNLFEFPYFHLPKYLRFAKSFASMDSVLPGGLLGSGGAVHHSHQEGAHT